MKKEQRSPKALVGFDGFIDTIIHPVKYRTGPDSWNRIETIKEFSETIEKASHKSANIECIEVSSLLGGNAPLFAQSASNLGVSIQLLGTLKGQSTSIDPIFSSLENIPQIQIYPIHNPGQTDAYEFYDGKILFGKMRGINTLSLLDLFQTISEAKIRTLLNEVDGIATLNWTMMPLIDEFWKWLSEKNNILPPGKLLFVDFSDPKKRSQAELQNAFVLLKQCTEAGFRVIISVNTSEAIQAIEALHGTNSSEDICPLTERLHALFPTAEAIIGHSRTQVAASWGQKSIRQLIKLSVPVVEKPYATTGAGDNFNGALFSALLHGYDYTSALKWAIIASGHWVRTRTPLQPPALKEKMNIETN